MRIDLHWVRNYRMDYRIQSRDVTRYAPQWELPSGLSVRAFNRRRQGRLASQRALVAGHRPSRVLRSQGAWRKHKRRKRQAAHAALRRSVPLTPSGARGT